MKFNLQKTWNRTIENGRIMYPPPNKHNNEELEKGQ